MLTINLFNAIFDSPYEVSSVEYKALVAVSSAIVFVHHTGYWIDTWATMEVLRSWGFSSFTNCDELVLSTNNKTSVMEVERQAVGAAGARPSDLQTKTNTGDATASAATENKKAKITSPAKLQRNKSPSPTKKSTTSPMKKALQK